MSAIARAWLLLLVGLAFVAPPEAFAQSDTIAGTGNNVSWSFLRSPASQVTSETRTDTAEAYAFPAIATTSRAYVANGLNQYASVASNSYAYDANGNLTSDGTGGNAYTYDVENRLVKAVAGTTTTNLLYDPLGRLVETDQGTAASTQRLLYDGEAMVAGYDSADALNVRYIHGSNAEADDPLVWYSGAGLTTKFYLHADRLGSIVAITNGNGASYARNAYDEYGVPAAANTGRFQYTGQMWLPQLGLYYYKGRFYSAQLGRFLQTDPIGYDGGINLYEYVGGDPINAVDYDGEFPDTFIDLGFLVYDGYKLFTEGATRENVAATGADALAAIIPGVTGAGLAVRSANRASEAARAEHSGLIYRRTNPKTGHCYIGRCDSPQNFARRQRDHDRQIGTRHDYETLETGIKPGRTLREAEQKHIDAHGGPTNKSHPNGGTENRRNEINSSKCANLDKCR